jgi:hypothetical protein
VIAKNEEQKARRRVVLRHLVLLAAGSITFSKTLSLRGPDLEAVIEQWNLVRALPYILLKLSHTAATEERRGIHPSWETWNPLKILGSQSATILTFFEGDPSYKNNMYQD